MSLKKLFNFDYFMQNLKKSKMSILLFLLVVPIFTSLLIITAGEELMDASFLGLGGFNVFFMYITPFILSLSLFGYVYKKRSADFMCSMPISRKSVFATNTIGGIILIILMQLLTVICTFVLFSVTKASTFSGLVWDIFVYQTIAYIFVYTVCNLAMSISGNFITQIVMILLILFVVPASTVFFNVFHYGSADLMDGEYEYNNAISLSKFFNFTAPAQVANFDYQFNVTSIIRMVVLSAIYIVLGFYAFKHKKMESAGESFENKMIHFVVKGLTLIPFVMIIVLLAEEDVWQVILFLIAIIAVYYLIYDLLTNKKSKFLTNMGAMILSIAVLFGFYKVLFEIGNNYTRKIDINDVKSYTVNGIGYTDFYLSEYQFKDINLLRKMLAERRFNDWNYYDRVNLSLTLKNGSKAKLTIYSVDKKNIQELINSAKVKNLPSNCVIKYHGVMFSRVQTEHIIKELNDYIKENGLYSYYEKITNSYHGYMTIYMYENHEVISMGLPIDLTSAIFEQVTQVVNQKTYHTISRAPYRGYYLNISNPSVMEKYLNDIYYYGEAPQEMIQLVLDSKDEVCDLKKEYVILGLGGNQFYTNKIQEVVSIIKKYGSKEEYYPEDEYDSYYYDYNEYPIAIEKVPTQEQQDEALTVEQESESTMITEGKNQEELNDHFITDETMLQDEKVDNDFVPTEAIENI